MDIEVPWGDHVGIIMLMSDNYRGLKNIPLLFLATHENKTRSHALVGSFHCINISPVTHPIGSDPDMMDTRVVICFFALFERSLNDSATQIQSI